MAGRRFGKTFLACVELIRAAQKDDAVAWYVAPTYKQAKRIAWKQVKKLTQGRTLGRPNETELSITLTNGSLIALKGADNYENLRGDGLDFLVLDEYASMKPEAWTEVLRPALADKLGRALFIGTPKGFNHFHELHTNATGKPDWANFQFTTLDGGNVSAEELNSAARDLDQKLFDQEFNATFENIGTGRAYHAFTRGRNVAPQLFNRQLDICWSWDFNIGRMSTVIAQIEDHSTRMDTWAGRKEKRLAILDEISLDGSIDEMCREFERRIDKIREPYGQMAVHLYGDPAGNSRNHSGVTDYQVIQQYFRSKSQFRFIPHVATSHMEVKDRINAVNAAFCNSLGEVRVQIDPRCKQLIADYEQVGWKSDNNGNLTAALDKSNPRLTHMADACDYFIAAELPVTGSHNPFGRSSLL